MLFGDLTNTLGEFDRCLINDEFIEGERSEKKNRRSRIETVVSPFYFLNSPPFRRNPAVEFRTHPSEPSSTSNLVAGVDAFLTSSQSAATARHGSKVGGASSAHAAFQAIISDRSIGAINPPK